MSFGWKVSGGGMSNRVAIVGGGPGGLMTAYLLRKLANRPLELTLFESSERVGGKVLTPRFTNVPAMYEAGAAEFYDYSPVDEDPLKDLVRELGLSTVAMGGNSVVLSGKQYSTLEDLGEQFGGRVRRGWTEFHERAWGLMSPREFYESDNSEPSLTSGGLSVVEGRFDTEAARLEQEELRSFLETLIHSDLATEWTQTSVSYGLQNYLMNHPAYMQLYSIDGGNEQLVERLRERTAMDVRTGQRVLSVEKGTQDSAALTLRTEGADGMTEHHFDYVVLCLPIIPLSKLEFCGERLAGAMRGHLERYDHPAHYLRVTMLFSQPFWKSWLRDSYCMLDAYGGCCLYDESSRQAEAGYGILGWLFGGEAAVSLSELGDEVLIERALGTLPCAPGESVPQPLEVRVHRWIGAVSALPGGERPVRLDMRHQPEPVEHPGLFVVGDYLFDSTLNGVLDSAESVASWIAAELES